MPHAARLILLAWWIACVGSADPPGTVRIGVFGLFRPQRLAVKPAPGRILEMHCGERVEHVEAGYAIGLTLAGVEIDCTVRNRMTSARSVAITGRGGAPAEFLLSVPGKIERRFAGTLEIHAQSGVLEPVVGMDREEAVAAITAAESLPGAEAPALEAQAVVARSYLATPQRRHEGFDFCDTTHCQFLREARPPGDAAREATQRTGGLVLSYAGSVFAPMFSAACGGRTRTPQNSGLAAQPYPYFEVDCAACTRDPQSWSATLTPGEAQPLIASPGSETARLAVARKLGWNVIRSNDYRWEKTGETVVFTGRGQGHGIGLCQRGAAGMARDGATLRAILEHYFPNTTLRTLE